MCHYFFTLLTLLLFSAGLSSCNQHPAETYPIGPSVASISNQLAAAVEPQTGTRFLDAAAKAESNPRAFDATVLAFGLSLNESIGTSLQLSPAVKAELDSSLRQNCPALSSELRRQYLASIPELADSTRFSSSTSNSLHAELLADAMGQMMCSYSTLVFGPLRMAPSLPTVVAASSILQAPCERLMRAPLLAMTGHLERSGLIRDINTTTAMLKADQISGAAELGTARLSFQVKAQHTVRRSVGYQSHQWEWEAGSLVQTYFAHVVWGYDFAADSSFQISIDDAHRQIVIHLPAASCLSVSLEPSGSVINDSGLQDISMDDLQAGFENARHSAVELARAKGAEGLATEHAVNFLETIYAPLTTIRHGTYTLRFVHPPVSYSSTSLTKSPSLL
jgi:hypothetical protein